MTTRRPFYGWTAAAIAAAALCAPLAFNAGAAHAQGAAVANPPSEMKHFHPRGKMPSTFTLELPASGSAPAARPDARLTARA